MILGISGSRRIKYGFGQMYVPRGLVFSVCRDFYLDTDWDVEGLCFGDAKGVDAGAKYFAQEYEIPYQEFEADWDKFGRSAGIRRNVKMAERIDGLFAIRFHKSTGTTHMIKTTQDHGKPVVVQDFTSELWYNTTGERKTLDIV